MKKIILLLAMGVALFNQTLFAQVPSYIPTNGLVGYWPFNGNANDVSPNANNGTNNGATLTADRFGNSNSAYSFDGSTSKIKVPHNNSLNAFPITISTWFKSQSNMGGMVSKYEGCSNNGWSIHSSNNKISGYYYNFSGGSYVNFDPNTSTIDINDNSWHQVVETYDASGGKIFIDGLLISADTFSGAGTPSVCSTIADLYFGYRVPGNPASCVNYNFFFQGIIDDIGIWNRALTQQEITNLYNANQCFNLITVTDTLIINVGQLSYNNPVTYANNITIAPNPASTQININFNNITNLNGGTLKIINSLGQEVATTPITTSGTNSTMQLATWGGTGMYFVQIINPQGQIVDIKKIILQ